MAQNSTEDPSAVVLKRAAALITEALDIVDGQGNCPDVATHLDLAVRRLRELLASPPESHRPD